jgi:hypothetical protein
MSNCFGDLINFPERITRGKKKSDTSRIKKKWSENGSYENYLR